MTKKLILILTILLSCVIIEHLWFLTYMEIYVNPTPVSYPQNHQLIPKLPHTIYPISAYNVGVVSQTDDSPCIGATNEDLCQALDNGENICASNKHPLGTILLIEDWGKCRVADRLNKKYSHRIDIAMKATEINEALKWGLKYKKVYQLN